MKVIIVLSFKSQIYMNTKKFNTLDNLSIQRVFYDIKYDVMHFKKEDNITETLKALKYILIVFIKTSVRKYPHAVCRQ